MKTLREIIEEHPEWLDIPVGIYTDMDYPDGMGYDMVGERGSVYLHDPADDDEDEDGEETEGEYYGPVVVFSGN